MSKVDHIRISKGMKVDELIRGMKDIGVMGSGRLGKAADILERMVKDKECKVFLGQAGALVPGGMRNILSGLLKKKLIEVFVTTGATLTHDLAEALGFKHEIGDEEADDSKLNKEGKDRMWNSYMDNKVYGKMEDFFEENW